MKKYRVAGRLMEIRLISAGLFVQNHLDQFPVSGDKNVLFFLV